MTEATFANLKVRRSTAGAVEDLLALDSVDSSAGNGAALSFLNNSATAGLHLTLGRLSTRRVDSATVRLDLAVASDPTVSSGDDTPPLLSLLSDADGLRVTTAGPLAVGGTLAVAGTTTLSDGLRVSGNLDVTGTVDGRDVSADGARLDQHLANTANPHATTAAQVGALSTAGGSLSGNLTISGNVGIGATRPEARLHIHSPDDDALKVTNTALGKTLRIGVDHLGAWLEPTEQNSSIRLNANPSLLGLLIDGQTGNVGIGTTSIHNPQGWNRVLDLLGTAHARLNVRSTGGVITSIFSHDNWAGARGVIGTESNHPLTFATNYTHRMTIDTAGNVGIGTPTPQYALDVNGVVRAVRFIPPSDERLKTNIAPLTDVLAKVARLRCVSFEWNAQYAPADRNQYGCQIGVIAQEVEAVFPELVVTSDQDGLKAVDYDRLAAVLLEAIKELQRDVEALKRRGS